jgi:hypothetical protein
MQTADRINVEHRKHNRYRLVAPVIFSWRDARHAPHKGVGLTRVLSTHGAFVLTADSPPVKANIDLKVFLPRIGAGVPMRFEGHGKVVRVEAVEHPYARAGFAVAAKAFALRKSPIPVLRNQAVLKFVA